MDVNAVCKLIFEFIMSFSGVLFYSFYFQIKQLQEKFTKE